MPKDSNLRIAMRLFADRVPSDGDYEALGTEQQDALRQSCLEVWWSISDHDSPESHAFAQIYGLLWANDRDDGLEIDDDATPESERMRRAVAELRRILGTTPDSISPC